MRCLRESVQRRNIGQVSGHRRLQLLRWRRSRFAGVVEIDEVCPLFRRYNTAFARDVMDQIFGATASEEFTASSASLLIAIGCVSELFAALKVGFDGRILSPSHDGCLTVYAAVRPVVPQIRDGKIEGSGRWQNSSERRRN